jgi:hypothetical protein
MRLKGGKKNCFTGCQPLCTCCHYTKMFRKPMCHTDSNATSTSVCAITCSTKEQLQKEKPIVKTLIHKQRLLSKLFSVLGGRENSNP